MSTNQKNTADLRLAELVAALSLATDLGMGQPLEYALSVCVLSVRLGEAFGLGEERKQFPVHADRAAPRLFAF